MKKTTAFCSFLLFGLLLTHICNAQINEYYLGVFSNHTNSIKFTIGAYPNTVSQSKRNDGSIYSAMRIAIVNNEQAEPIVWSDYKIYILLKDGTLFYNFLTNATTGEYSCKYTVDPGTTHLQLVCFEKIFTATDVEKIWLSFSDSQFLPLIKYKDEVEPAEPVAPADAKSKKSLKK